MTARAALAAMAGLAWRRWRCTRSCAASSSFFREPNPATVIWSAHAGYFWRVLIVSYAGGMAAVMTWAAASAAPDRVARLLPSAVAVAAALILLQGLPAVGEPAHPTITGSGVSSTPNASRTPR